MKEALESLRRRRTGIILLNLGYFLALLAAGTLAFLRGAAPAVVYPMFAACIAAYLLAVRPATRRYAAAVREAILRHTVCRGIENFRHVPKEGLSAGVIQDSGLLADNSAKGFFSREHITGQSGELELELADVAFPIVEEGRNHMFNGACIQLRWPGAAFPAVSVRRGELSHLRLPKAQMNLLEELGSLIPGSLYLLAAEETLTVLLRGRFLGFSVNPLMPLTEARLAQNPFPELERTVALARLMKAGH